MDPREALNIWRKHYFLGICKRRALEEIEWSLLLGLACLLSFFVGCTAPLASRAPVVPNTTIPTAALGPRVDCASLDRDHRTFGALAKFAGVLAGSGGLAVLPVPDDQKAIRLTIGISALVIGGLSAASIYIEQDAASVYAKECTQ